MKNILLVLIPILILYSCSSEFKDKSQAKNEVNKKGLRDGRWVDFFDEDNNKIIDTTNYTSYLLSEYKEGKPINAFKIFFKNGLIKEEGTFLSDSLTFGINSLPNKFINKYIDYSQDGKILEIKSFNELGNIIEAQYNFKQDTLRLVYKYSLAKQNKFEAITINEKESKTVFQYADVSWFDDENNFPNEFHDNVIKNYKKVFSKTDNLNEIQKTYYKILTNIFYDKQTTFYSSSMTSLNKISGKEEVTDMKELNIKSYKAWKSNKTAVASNGSGGEVKSCRYCGRSFYKNQGYVVGLGISCAKNYSSAINEIAIAANAGYSKSNISQLMSAYNLGQYYCSRRCVYESGTNMCAE